MIKYFSLRYLLRTLAHYYYDKGSYYPASNAFRLLHLIYPHNIADCINLGASYYHINKIEDSIRICEKALNLDSTNVDLNINLIRIYESKKLSEDIFNTYVRLVEAGYKIKKEDGISVYVLYDLAFAYNAKKEYNTSAKLLLLGLEWDADNLYLLHGYGVILSEMEKYDEAIIYYEKCVCIKDDFHYAYSNRAYCFLKEGKFELSIIDINKAIDLAPEFAFAYEVRSFYNLLLNKRDEALKDWELSKSFEKKGYTSTGIKELIAEFEGD